MMAFRYRAVDGGGRVQTGRIADESADQAAGRLEQQGLVILDLHEHASLGIPRTLSRRQLAILFRNLAALTAAGVPLERAVASSRTLADGRLLAVVTRARAQLREGNPLSKAIDDGSGALPAVVIGMLRGGERVGRIPEALDQVAEHLEREAALSARVRQALAYPVVLLAVGAVAMGILLTRVVPRFALLIAGSGTEPPVSTRILLAAANAINQHQGTIAFVLACGAAGIVGALRSASIRSWLNLLLVQLPVIGPLHESLASARICAVLAGMLQAGGAVLPALTAAGEAAGNPFAARRLEEAARRVREGSGLARALGDTRAVTNAAVQLISIGEESGRVPEMARRASELSALEAGRGLDTVVTMIEPGLILIFGSIVAFVAAALLQAVYGLQAGTLS
jgi:type II secretory pathway component PulF